MSTTLLLAEDDERLGALIAEYLTLNGFRVERVLRGDLALECLRACPPTLAILDVMLPGLDGIEVCRLARATWDGPILMLTASDDDSRQMLGLAFGADDYVIKPIAPPVLLARVRALLRRSPATPVMRFGPLNIDRAARLARVGNTGVALTSAEFDLLVVLASAAGRPLDRDALMQALRGLEFDGLDRSVDLRVSRLRRKLRDAGDHEHRIVTVRGRGYQFNPQCEAAPC